jgi:hypothetical protein
LTLVIESDKLDDFLLDSFPIGRIGMLGAAIGVEFDTDMVHDLIRAANDRG